MSFSTTGDFTSLFYVLYCQMKVSVLFKDGCFHLFILRFVLPDESKCPFPCSVFCPTIGAAEKSQRFQESLKTTARTDEGQGV